MSTPLRSRRRPPRVPRSVTIDGFDAHLVSTGLDENGHRWTVRGAPVGGTVAVVGPKDGGIRVGLVAPAPDAVTPPCPQFGTCGGCQYQEMPLERQREAKLAALTELLAPLGGRDHGLVGVPDAAYGWRNKLELSCGPERYLPREALADESAVRAGRWIGMHAPGRFDRIVDIERCDLVSDAMNRVMATAMAAVRGAEWPLWDVHRHEGFFRNLVLREGDPDDKGVPTVIVAVYTSPGDDAQAAWLRREAPTWGAAGVMWFENDLPADAVQGTLREVLHGVDSLTETLGHVRFRLSPSAFFQANLAGATLLAEWVAKFARQGDRGALWDLYCGTGALGIYCAKDFESLVGIDANAASIADAAANAALNGLPDARFYAGNVEDLVATLPRDPPPTILLDPPRVGLHPRARGFVAGLTAYPLIYVACKPTSLLRDGQYLQEEGWVCTDRVAVDLFPQTAHVEVVTRWVRAGDEPPVVSGPVRPAVQAPPPDPSPGLGAPSIVEEPEQLVALLPLRIPKADIRKVMGPAIGELYATVRAQGGTVTGPWFSHHHRIAPDEWDFEIGVPVAAPIRAAGRVVPGVRPVVRGARAVLRGGYEGMADGWGALLRWMAENGHAPAPDLWERYLVGPETSSDPADWRTELIRPVRG